MSEYLHLLFVSRIVLLGSSIMAIIKIPHISSGYIPIPRVPTGGAGRFQMKIKVRFTNRGHRIEDFRKKWAKSLLSRIGGYVRTSIIRGMRRRTKMVVSNPKYPKHYVHSPKGTPPYAHVKKSEFLNQAILFHADPIGETVVIGTSFRRARFWGAMHEHGGVWAEKHPKRTSKKTSYFHRRPFIGPVVTKIIAEGKIAMLVKKAEAEAGAGIPAIGGGTYQKEWAYEQAD